MGYFHYHVGDEPIPGHRLIAHLGQGGFGEVWKVKAPGSVLKAIKIIDVTGPQGVKEFKSLDVVKNLSHPNLVTIHGCWMKDAEGNVLADTLFEVDARQAKVSGGREPGLVLDIGRPVELLIAMDLGRMNLHSLLEKCVADGKKGIPPHDLIDYMYEAAKAIDYLNDLRPPIVHGDIKPHNILLIGEESAGATGVKICDYGLCKALQTAHQTQTQTPVTVAYAAPELFEGAPTLKSDQYSLAITYYELRTGRLPFSDESLNFPVKVMRLHQLGRLNLSGLLPEARQVIARATSVKPEDRWPSAREMVKQLKTVEGVDSIRITPPPPAPPPSPWDSKKVSGPGRTMENPSKDLGQTDLIPPDPNGEFEEQLDPAGRTVQLKNDPTKSQPRPTTHYRQEDDPDEPPGWLRRRLVPMLLAGAAAGATAVLMFYVLHRTDIPPPSPPPPALEATIRQMIRDGKTDEALNLLEKSGSALSPETEQELTKGCLNRWSADTLPEVEKGYFHDALKFVDLHRNFLGEQADSLEKDIKQSWLQGASLLIEGHHPTEAVAFLKDIPPGIPDKDMSARRDGILQVWTDDVFGRAGTTVFKVTPAMVDALKTPLEGIATPSQIHELRKAQGSRWKDHAAQILQLDEKERFDEAGQVCATLLGFSEFADDPELRILRARLFLHQADPNPKDAQLELQAARRNPPGLPKNLEVLASALDLLSRSAPSEPDDQVCNAIKTIREGEKSAVQSTGSWTLNYWENSRIDHLAEISCKQSETSAGGNCDMLLKTVDGQIIKTKEFDEAKKTLELLKGANCAWKDREFYVALVAVGNPNAELNEIKETISNLRGLLSDTLGDTKHTERGHILISTLKACLARANVDKVNALQDQAIDGIAGARQEGDGASNPELAELHSDLSMKRIQRNFQAIRGNADDLDPPVIAQVTDDYKNIQPPKPAAADDPRRNLVDEFWLECQIQQGNLNDPALRQTVAEAEARASRHPSVDPYYGYAQYVLASATFERRPGPKDAAWKQIQAQLDLAYPDAARAPDRPEMDVYFRRRRAAQALVKVAENLYVPTSVVLDRSLLDLPFQLDDDAQNAYAVLDKAGELWKEGASKSPRLQFNLAMAAMWKPKPDLAQARAMSSGVVPALNVQARPDLDGDLVIKPLSELDTFRVLYVYFRTHQRETDRPGTIFASRWLAKLFEKYWSDDDEQAGNLYEKVMRLAEVLADREARARPAGVPKGMPPEHEFYGTASEFLEHFRYIQLAGKQPRLDKIEELLNRGIPTYQSIGEFLKDSPITGVDQFKLAKYLVRRGVARADLDPPGASHDGVGRANPNLDGAGQDAKDAMAVLLNQKVGTEEGMGKNSDLVNALSLEGTVQLLRARQATCSKARWDDRATALVDIRKVNGEELKKYAASDDERVDHLVLESMVNLEIGNEPPKSKEIGDYLKTAVDRASEAAALKPNNPEIAYTALGNAYEDRALLARINPPTNYKLAIRQFGEAIEAVKRKSSFAVSPMIARGRCYVECLPLYDDRKNDAQAVFDNTSKETMIANAEEDLTRGIQEGGSSEPAIAHFWRGRLYQYQRKFDAAEDDFKEAAQLAKRANDPVDAVIFLQQWATARIGPYYDLAFDDLEKKQRTAHDAADRTRTSAQALEKTSLASVHWPRDLTLDAGTIEARCDNYQDKPDRALDSLQKIKVEQAGCGADELNASQSELLALRLELRWKALSKLASDGKKWDLTNLEQFQTDAKALIDAMNVPDRYKALAYTCEARRLKGTNGDLTMALDDFDKAIELYNGDDRHRWEVMIEYAYAARAWARAPARAQEPVAKRLTTIQNALASATAAMTHLNAKDAEEFNSKVIVELQTYRDGLK